MKLQTLAMAMAAALATAAVSRAALAAADQIVIGDIDDMSGVYADVLGAGGVEAINMAIADFGGTVLGKKIVTLNADHQNKPDIGASKFRQWADEAGLNLLLGGSNTDRKSTRLNSSHGYISYAVFCLKKKNTTRHRRHSHVLNSSSTYSSEIPV